MPPAWGVGLGWAPWGSTDWRFFRAWILARISKAIPLTVWDAGELPASLPYCPCCDKTEVGLAHLVEDCPGTAEARAELETPTLKYALQGDPDVEVLRRKVRAVGKACATAVAGLMGSLGASAEEHEGAAEPDD